METTVEIKLEVSDEVEDVDDCLLCFYCSFHCSGGDRLRRHIRDVHNDGDEEGGNGN